MVLLRVVFPLYQVFPSFCRWRRARAFATRKRETYPEFLCIRAVRIFSFYLDPPPVLVYFFFQKHVCKKANSILSKYEI